MQVRAPGNGQQQQMRPVSGGSEGSDKKALWSKQNQEAVATTPATKPQALYQSNLPNTPYPKLPSQSKIFPIQYTTPHTPVAIGVPQMQKYVKVAVKKTNKKNKNKNKKTKRRSSNASSWDDSSDSSDSSSKSSASFAQSSSNESGDETEKKSSSERRLFKVEFTELIFCSWQVQSLPRHCEVRSSAASDGGVLRPEQGRMSHRSHKLWEKCARSHERSEHFR